ncbi:isotrichodermin C-15 hydroxylase [Hypoxylon rubiginosum]|uniref:Isotrichodermin C-15 hydroxylase n=1 Tax=Hypoxylon rubiginosum TaxID=110542 RepID=A0ACB9YW86_9PEZI|nr:isotrichodermin C-15 hydroxylase [Hypoxylon rubiginosum]
MERIQSATVGEWATLAIVSTTLYAALRCFYLLYWHPLAKYPGPKLAAVSNAWYGWHWTSGKSPWAIARVLEKYGDVVRIAPNELVFITPQAQTDIYASHTKNLEHFVRTDWLDPGLPENGLTFELDPVKHRMVAKKLSPAFSVNSIKAKEPTLHKYINYFIDKMKEIGGSKDGVELRTWTDWLAMDISADLAYSREMHQMQQMKSSPLLDSLHGVNFFMALNRTMKQFPLLGPFKYLFIPPSIITSLPKIVALNQQEAQKRIERRGKTQHLDYFEQLLPADAPDPDKKELAFMEVMAVQLLNGGYEPISSQFQCTLMFLLHQPESYRRVVKEIRDAFTSYDEITPETCAHLKYLHAALMETLRITVIGANGMPRTSPGAVVDGHYIPKGVTVQYGHFALTRSPRYFHDGDSFRPERWLPADHPHWDPAFARDHLEAFKPFSQGPRICPGMGAAWRQTRLFVAKVLWSLDAEAAPGQREVVFERDFRQFMLWEKPKYYVRFREVVR